MPDAHQPATIRDVAALAGVSVTTVSNYFNKPERMSAGTRERVRAAVATLRFAPSDAARNLRRVRSSVVGYISYELASARTPAITNAMSERLAGAGMHLLSAVDGGDPEREQAFLDLFERQRVAGLVITPVTDVEPRLARLRLAGIPSVLSAQRASDSEQPSVSIDHRQGGRLAAQHLLDIGRRRLAFVADDLDLHQVSERFRGAMDVVGQHPDAALEVVTCAERSVAGGEGAAAQLLRRPAGELPEGIFCVNDLVALGLVGTLQSSVSIPGDVAVVGYDDIEFARLGAVPLTTIRTPQEGMGVAVADLLLAQMAPPVDGDAGSALQVELEPRLVPRASTGG